MINIKISEDGVIYEHSIVTMYLWNDNTKYSCDNFPIGVILAVIDLIIELLTNEIDNIDDIDDGCDTPQSSRNHHNLKRKTAHFAFIHIW